MGVAPHLLVINLIPTVSKGKLTITLASAEAVRRDLRVTIIIVLLFYWVINLFLYNLINYWGSSRNKSVREAHSFVGLQRLG